MLKKLDLFGTEYPFRIDGYEKYKRKTGGCLFLIYLFAILAYFTHRFYNYFIHPKYETFHYEEPVAEEGVNLKEDNFTIIFPKENDGNFLTQDLLIESNFHEFTFRTISEDYENFTNCKRDNFDFKKSNYNKNTGDENIINYSECINIDSKNSKFFKKGNKIEFEITGKFIVSENDQHLNFFYDVYYPLNIIHGLNSYQILGHSQLILKKRTFSYKIMEIKKEKYIIDDELFFAGNKTRNYLNHLYDYSFYKEIDIPEDNELNFVISIITHPTVKVKYLRRKKIYDLFFEMLSMATTLLTNVGFIGRYLNLKYSRISIFEKFYHINSFDDDIRIRKIEMMNKINNEGKEKVINLHDDRSNINIKIKLNNGNSSNRSEIISFSKIDKNKKKENLNSNIERDKIFKGNKIDNIDEINEKHKLIKRKIEEFSKKYPTIGYKADYKKDERFNRNAYEFILITLKCNKKRLNIFSRLNSIIDKEFSKSLNVENFIKRTKKLEVIEDILFNPNEKILLDYIALPTLNVKKENNEKIMNHKFDDDNYVFNEYCNIDMRNDKTDIER